MDKIIKELENALSEERGQIISQVKERHFKTFWYETAESFLNEVECDWDLENTIWEQGFLMWFNQAINTVKHLLSK